MTQTKFGRRIFSFLLATSGVALLAVGCAANANATSQNVQTIRFSVFSSASQTNQTLDEWATAITNVYNNNLKQGDKMLRPIRIETSTSGSQGRIDAIRNGSADVTFASVGRIMRLLVQEDNTLFNNIVPKIQTLTEAFVFDQKASDVYVNGSMQEGQIDPLIKIAKHMQAVSFGKKPFSMWTDEEFMWNGTRYNAFYAGLTNLTNHYRGMILVAGNDDKIRQVREAWQNKDWETFRNAGIIYGDMGSDGNFRLQELLLKQHFGPDKFTTLAEDIATHQAKYKIDPDGTSLIGTEQNFAIAFSDEGSFAWNHAVQKTAFQTSGDRKIEVLTVTNPSFYDIGLFNHTLGEDVINNLAMAIIQAEQDVVPKKMTSGFRTYADGGGYNGFRVIEDFTSEVINPWKQTFFPNKTT